MLRVVTILIVALSVFCPSAHVLAEQIADTSPAAKAYQSLLDEYDKVGSAREMTGKFFEFAMTHAKAPQAVDALAWIATHRRYRPEADRAVGLLQSDHLQSPRLGKAIGPVAKGPTPAAERLLLAALEKSPHADVQAQACYHLVSLLDLQSTLAAQIAQQPSLRKRAAQYYGRPPAVLGRQESRDPQGAALRDNPQIIRQGAGARGHDGRFRQTGAVRHAPSFRR